MAWQKSQSGNPGGRPKEKPFTDALRIVLAEDDSSGQKRKLRVIADKLVEVAMAGEPWAIREVMDRIDGKPTQSIDATVNDERDVRDLSSAELARRAEDALSRIEKLTAGTGRKRAGKSRPADVRQLN